MRENNSKFVYINLKSLENKVDNLSSSLYSGFEEFKNEFLDFQAERIRQENDAFERVEREKVSRSYRKFLFLLQEQKFYEAKELLYVDGLDLGIGEDGFYLYDMAYRLGLYDEVATYLEANLILHALDRESNAKMLAFVLANTKDTDHGKIIISSFIGVDSELLYAVSLRLGHFDICEAAAGSVCFDNDFNNTITSIEDRELISMVYRHFNDRCLVLICHAMVFGFHYFIDVMFEINPSFMTNKYIQFVACTSRDKTISYLVAKWGGFFDSNLLTTIESSAMIYALSLFPGVKEKSAEISQDTRKLAEDYTRSIDRLSKLSSKIFLIKNHESVLCEPSTKPFNDFVELSTTWNACLTQVNENIEKIKSLNSLAVFFGLPSFIAGVLCLMYTNFVFGGLFFALSIITLAFKSVQIASFDKEFIHKRSVISGAHSILINTVNDQCTFDNTVLACVGAFLGFSAEYTFFLFDACEGNRQSCTYIDSSSRMYNFFDGHDFDAGHVVKKFGHKITYYDHEMYEHFLKNESSTSI